MLDFSIPPVILLASSLFLAQSQGFVMTDGMVVAICGVVTALIMQVFVLIMFLLKTRADDRHRAEDKADRVALAILTKAGLDANAAGITANMIEGGARESRIFAKVTELESKADAAYVAGNGNQEKFVVVAQRLEEHSKALGAVPAKVELVQDAAHPIHTTLT